MSSKVLGHVAVRRALTGPMALAVAPRRCYVSPTAALLAKLLPFKLADIGEGIQQVEVLQVYVKPGDPIEELDPICEVQSDKATVEITSRFTGRVKNVHVTKGALAKVGAALVDIEVEEEGATAAAAAVEEPTPVSVTTPSAPPTAPAAGPAPGTKALATPATRYMAKELGVDLAHVTPTGKGGRVLKEDILAFLDSKTAGSAGTSAVHTPPVSHVPRPTQPQSQHQHQPQVVAPVAPSVVAAAEDRVVPLVGVRRAMVASMTQANSIPSFGACDEIDVSNLITLRNEMRVAVAERSPLVKLTFMPFFLKAASLALLRYPELNAFTSTDCTELIVKSSHHIGFAMDTPNGLIVPVLRDVQRKSVLEIAADMQTLVEKGRRGSFPVEDLRGGTFSLSNIGSIGATYTKPVILPPQVAIGAVGRVQKMPRFDAKGNVFAANIINVSWSADHRVIDGATMVRFSNLFKTYLETPGLMLMDTR